MSERIWTCKIGAVADGLVPDGADWPMRQAVAAAYLAVTGKQPDFTFSGWGSELTDIERACAYPARTPSAPVAPERQTLEYIGLMLSCDDIRSCWEGEGCTPEELLVRIQSVVRNPQRWRANGAD